jgi:hypothetical protein
MTMKMTRRTLHHLTVAGFCFAYLGAMGGLVVSATEYLDPLHPYILEFILLPAAVIGLALIALLRNRASHLIHCNW